MSDSEADSVADLLVGMNAALALPSAVSQAYLRAKVAHYLRSDGRDCDSLWRRQGTVEVPLNEKTLAAFNIAWEPCSGGGGDGPSPSRVVWNHRSSRNGSDKAILKKTVFNPNDLVPLFGERFWEMWFKTVVVFILKPIKLKVMRTYTFSYYRPGTGEEELESNDASEHDSQGDNDVVEEFRAIYLLVSFKCRQVRAYGSLGLVSRLSGVTEQSVVVASPSLEEAEAAAAARGGRGAAVRHRYACYWPTCNRRWSARVVDHDVWTECVHCNGEFNVCPCHGLGGVRLMVEHERACARIDAGIRAEPALVVDAGQGTLRAQMVVAQENKNGLYGRGKRRRKSEN